MAFRRGFQRRSFRRRRRRGPETYTVTQCRILTDMANPSTCSSPIITSFPLMLPTPAVGGSDPTTAGAVINEKGKTVLGIKFQYEYSTDPAEWLGSDEECDVNPNRVAFNLTVWEGIVVLPLAAGSKTLPAYLPQFTNASQSFDIADRVLWKRLSFLPLWGLLATGGVPQLEITMRDEGHGPVRVPAKVALDDRHGLFFVQNWVHNIAFTSSSVCQIPIFTDGWFKIFYRTRM